LNFKVKGWIDDSAANKKQKKINGLKVISVKEFLSKSNLNNIVVVVSIWNPKFKFAKAKTHKFKKISNNFYHYKDIVRAYPKVLVKYSMFGDGSKIIRNWDKIIEIYNQLKDMHSKRQFYMYIDWLVNNKFYPILPKVNKNQYFPSKVVNLSKIEYIIDIGAFVGDTFLHFKKNKKLNLKKYIAIEPDTKNFKKLEKNLKKNNRIKEVNCINKAISNKVKNVYFNNTGKESSSITKKPKGSIEIETVTIDSLTDNLNYVLIAADVEGHEIEILKSSIKTIKKGSATFAISTYHNEKHIYQIYDFFLDHLKNYNVYFRVHGHDFVDSVLYFVPKK
jgi:FkbM family methyltransferase